MRGVCVHSSGFTALLKASGYCRSTSAVWAVFQSALAAGVVDTRLCNTALSQLLHQRDTVKAEQVLTEMDSRGIARSDVTVNLGAYASAVCGALLTPPAPAVG